MGYCYLNLNTLIPNGNYTFTSTIVPSPTYPTGVTYTGTAAVSSVANYCNPNKVSSKTITTTGTISATTVTSSENFISKCDNYSSISPGRYFFNGDYKICKKGFGSLYAKYKGFSQIYNSNVKGKTIFSQSANGFTESIYYKINCGGYTLFQTIIFTRV